MIRDEYIKKRIKNLKCAFINPDWNPDLSGIKKLKRDLLLNLINRFKISLGLLQSSNDELREELIHSYYVLDLTQRKMKILEKRLNKLGDTYSRNYTSFKDLEKEL
jgi:hypothetical protein